MLVWAEDRSGAPDTPAASEIIPVEEVHRGQKGYGLSVFAGSEPVRFEVEVLGVLANVTPEISYILARLSGQNLEHSGVLAGMSGSPIYIDGRLAGALSFSYLYGLDPIAGITPIAAMRRLSELPRSVAGTGRGNPSSVEMDSGTSDSLPAGSSTFSGSLDHVPSFADLLGREFDPEALVKALGGMHRGGTDASRAAFQWGASGFSGASAELLRAQLGVTAAGGAGALSGTLGGQGESLQEALVPGGAVAAILVSGDFSLAAHGTVTEMRGRELLAFGHPLFSLGSARVPMATSEVVTPIASRLNSFKLSNAGAVVGAFDEDREAGVRGILGLEAPMFPLSVELRGLVERDYAMRVAYVPQLTPAMVALSTLGALTAGSNSGGPQGIDLKATIRLRGHEDLPLRQSFDSDQAGLDSAIFLLSFVSYLVQNSLEEVQIEGVEVSLREHVGIRLARLVAAEAERREVRRGEKVELILTLEPYRGEPYRLRTTVEIPQTAPIGSYYLMVGDGTSMDGVRLAVEKREPRTLAQSLEILRGFGSRRQLRVFGLLAGRGLATAGEALPMLPGSMASIFGAASTEPGVPLRLAMHAEQEEWVERPFEGVLRIDLEVKADD